MILETVALSMNWRIGLLNHYPWVVVKDYLRNIETKGYAHIAHVLVRIGKD